MEDFNREVHQVTDGKPWNQNMSILPEFLYKYNAIPIT